MKLNTKYMGLNLKSPIIVASSGLTSSASNIKELENAGAGAVILKSLFEEQITGEVSHLLTKSNLYPEAEEYIKAYTRQHSLTQHIDLLREAKSTVSIPVIASISCISANEWVSFAKELENAGADALELNVFYVPTGKDILNHDIEQSYVTLLQEVCKEVSIPVAMKIGCNFTNIVAFVEKLLAAGASAVTMFNRFYEPDININTLEMISGEIFSNPSDIRRSLRWIGITSTAVPELEIAASTGIHDGEAAIKQLLAGAQVVQVCSSVYINGNQVIAGMLQELRDFMQKWNFKSIADFRGRLSYKGVNPQMYERAQFMRYFSEY
ncbi:MAG: dihydroorotate dehydrogenase-like protein [Mangrovibacterium sp.]